MRNFFVPLIAAFFFLSAAITPMAAQSSTLHLPETVKTKLCDSLKTLLDDGQITGMGQLRIQKIKVNRTSRTVSVTFNTVLSEYPMRTDKCHEIKAIIQAMLPGYYRRYNLLVQSDGKTIEEMIPAALSGSQPIVHEKILSIRHELAGRKPLVTPLDRPYMPEKGLQNRHIALWQSHGWYYEQQLLRWEWQRARIFQTVEDLYTQGYVLPFLVPMLERAGATVLMPRERDTQTHEVIVDNDTRQGYREFSEKNAWKTEQEPGFAHHLPYYLNGQNPFRMGTFRSVPAYNPTREKPSHTKESSCTWTPNIPESGNYAVYVSYKTLPQSVDDAHYTVVYAGGEKHFSVNQQMGGGTWIYLGTFPFNKGHEGYVRLSNVTANPVSRKLSKVVTADAVKFGGGMGNMARQPQDSAVLARYGLKDSSEIAPLVSGYPRWVEGARYWLQWAGFVDTVYNKNEGKNDYVDDYSSRGSWVNALAGGSPFIPDEPGLRIPVDLAFAFHTDAGTYPNDSIVGTLAIYTRNRDGQLSLPTGEDREVSRAYTDMVQTQIVDDIRSLFCPYWKRRPIWNKSYAESRIPQVPTMLLELLSHQNFADMRFGLDPYFRFTVSRAIYKGMLRFLSSRYGVPYVVQPLPVKAFRIEFAPSDKAVELQWSAQADPLEASAAPKAYLVYTRVDDGPWDQGQKVKENFLDVAIREGHHYRFKVTALNEGGESFDSEVLAVYKAPREKGRMLIINGFTRISAPDSYATRDTSRAGFLDAKDGGVPYLYDISYIGPQYEYRRHIPWMDDDAPGFGASYSQYEDKMVAGNTFDYPFLHGVAAAAAGYSYTSTSIEAVCTNKISTLGWSVVDLILGKQKAVYRGGKPLHEAQYFTFPEPLRHALFKCAAAEGRILVSGSFTGTDLWDGVVKDSLAQAFARDVLKYTWRTGQASPSGRVQVCRSPFSSSFSGDTDTYTFPVIPNSKRYCVEAPDAIEPATKDAYSVFRYADSHSAGVAWKGRYRTVVLGFPLECLDSQAQINEMMAGILRFLTDPDTAANGKD